ncbi:MULTISPECIES: tetratricopeptide repeat-containing sensor histidine kinase [unclassified Cellulophaga]|uniref:tetratricopeptide repeat-containing sensor histidine kinase n=1 Tax=unclassified Cellulophaga TaxID=2634405 RepID=UPI0026E23D07|nr:MULTISPECIES: histidine kinase [unclassified Cellulophaga]MDO6492117.1 histidine kinase [Cellulophaga sp. 2_MG-2023]MDO6495722.1 histidine kinase [Cellulophaga sp. 3_MG-2023]
MNKLKFIITFLLCSLIYTGLKAQQSPKELFEAREFEAVIDTLTKKSEFKELNLDELFYITKSYGRTRQYSNGLVFSNKMTEKAMKLKDTTNLVRAFNLMAENLIDLNDITKGIEYCEKVAPVFREKDSIEFQKLCFKWGMMYYHNNQYKKAHDIYNNITLPKYRKLSLFTNNYALTLMGLEKWDEAIVYLKKSIKKSKNNRSVHYSNIGFAYLKQEKYKEAEVYLDSAVTSISDNTSLYNQKSIYSHYFLMYKNQNNVEKAVTYLARIESLNEAIFKQKISEKIKALETSSKQLEFANTRETTLKKQVKIIDNRLALAEKQKIWGAFILVILVVVLFAVLFIFKYRNIINAHVQIQTEQRLLRSQMTPHFIFNSLSVIQGMILNKEDKKAIIYLSKFSKLLRIILENSREKLVSLKEELQALQNYIDLQNMSRENSFKYTLNIDENIDTSIISIPPMLMQPFVENAIEHGFNNNFENAEISILIHFKDSKLSCIIIDNGLGINKTSTNKRKSKKSVSTQISAERLKIMSKELRVETGLTIEDRSQFNEQGTIVTLTLPYKIEKEDA